MIGDVGAAFSQLPVRRLQRHPETDVDLGSWPATLPAVRQVLTDGSPWRRDGLGRGENGTGKSTLVEAVAIAYGMSPEGVSIFPTLDPPVRVRPPPVTPACPRCRGLALGILSEGRDHARLIHFTWRTIPGVATPPTTRCHTGSRSWRFWRPGSTPPASTCSTNGIGLVCSPGAWPWWAASTNCSPTPRRQWWCPSHSPIVAALPGATILEAWTMGAAARHLDGPGTGRSLAALPRRPTDIPEARPRAVTLGTHHHHRCAAVLARLPGIRCGLAEGSIAQDR